MNLKITTALALSISALSFAQTAKADIIKCVYTEPFFNTVYSMAQQTLTITNPETPKKVIKNVSFQIKGAGRFELIDANKKVLQVMILNNQGSDGMSDFDYPYDSILTNKDFPKLHGGCESNYLRKVDSTYSL